MVERNDETSQSTGDKNPRVRSSSRSIWLILGYGFIFLIVAFLAIGFYQFWSLSRQTIEQLDVASRQLDVASATQQAMATRLVQADADLRATRVTGLANQIETEQADHPQLGLLLTLEGIRLDAPAPSPKLLQDLVDQLGRTGGKVLGRQGGRGALGFSHDGRWLVAPGPDQAIKVWDMNAPDPSASSLTLKMAQDPLRFAFSPDGHWMAIGGNNQSQGGTVILWELEKDQRFAKPLILPTVHEGGVSALSFSPDDRWLATSSYEGGIYLWDLDRISSAETPIELIGSSSEFYLSPMWVTQLDFSPDSNWLAASDFNSATYVWNIGTRAFDDEPKQLIGTLYYEVRSAKFDPAGDWLATAGGDGLVRLWPYNQGGVSDTPRIVGTEVGSAPRVSFSSDGKWLMSYDDGAPPHLWRDRTDPGRQIILEGQRYSAFSPDGRWLASGGLDNTIRLYSLAEQPPTSIDISGLPPSVVGAKEIQVELSSYIFPTPYELRGHDGALTAFAFSPGDRWLASAGEDGSIRLWGLRPFDLTANPTSFSDLGGEILHSALSHDGHWLATVSAGAVIKLWDMTEDVPNSHPVQLKGPVSEITAVRFSHDNRFLAAGDEDGSVWLWSMQGPSEETKPTQLPPHAVSITDIAFSPDNRWLVSGSLDLTARLWDLTASDPRQNYITLRGHGAGITHLAISSDGRWLATGSMDDTVRLWDLTQSDPSANSVVLSGHEGEISSLAFGPDGRWLATGSKDNMISLWDLKATDPSGRSIVMDGGGQEICCVAFSPTGRWLATGSSGKLWDLSQIDVTTTSLNPSRQIADVTALAFSPDGRWLAQAGEAISLLDMQSPDMVNLPYTLPISGQIMGDMVFSPDGRSIVAGGVWRFLQDDLYQRACQVVGRNLTKYEWDAYFPGEKYHRTCEQWPGDE